MPAKNLDLYTKAYQLRIQGKSYGQIYKEMGVPKGTLSSWFSKLNWSKAITDRLTVETRKKNYEHIRFMNKYRLDKAKALHESYLLAARQEYELLKENRLFISGLCLYWGEGDKRNKYRVSLINSDPLMLALIVNFYRKILNIPNDRIRAGLFIYADIDKKDALNYWSNVLELPEQNFIKTQVLISRSKLTKTKVPKGMCSLYFSSSEFSIKIKEWLRLFAMDMRE